MPESPLTSNTAASPHGRPGRVPDLRTPGRPRPPRTPGHRTARVTTAISAPPVPGPDGMHARLSGGRRATDGPPRQPVRGRPWKADGAHRPSWRPDAVRYMSVDTATQGPTALQGDTRRDKKETARIAENSQLSGRFRRWWQVLGSNQRRLSRRFYRPPQLRSVYGLWPAVTLPGSIDGDVASHVCPTQRGFGLRSWTVSLGIGAFRGSHVP